MADAKHHRHGTHGRWKNLRTRPAQEAEVIVRQGPTKKPPAMTPAQEKYLRELCRQAGERFNPAWTKRQAGQRINQLKRRLR